MLVAGAGAPNIAEQPSGDYQELLGCVLCERFEELPAAKLRVATVPFGAVSMNLTFDEAVVVRAPFAWYGSLRGFARFLFGFLGEIQIRTLHQNP